MRSDGEIICPKGPVIATAIVAGTTAVKNTSSLIPFSHPIPIEGCEITIEESNQPSALKIDCKVEVSHKTGAEMDALAGCSVASLCVYDMLKSDVSHEEISIEHTKLI
eukprot:847106_1